MRIALLLALLALCTALCFAQSSTPIAYPFQSFGSYYAMEAQAVPTMTTVLTTKNLIFGGGWIECSGTQTITITDGNGKTPIPTVPWSGPQVIGLGIFSGSYISGGLSIAASATGCQYHMWWRQQS